MKKKTKNVDDIKSSCFMSFVSLATIKRPIWTYFYLIKEYEINLTIIN